MQTKMAGASIKARLELPVALIWEKYKTQGISSDRLAILTETVISKGATSALKLKARGLKKGNSCPLAICQRLFDRAVEVEEATFN